MNIFGIGLDIVEVTTIALALQRDPSCGDAWLTVREQNELGTRIPIAKALAGRIAAKEAVVKAVRTGFAGDITWQDLEIMNGAHGAPFVELLGPLKRAASAAGVTTILLTIAHSDKFAVASAMAICDIV